MSGLSRTLSQAGRINMNRTFPTMRAVTMKLPAVYIMTNKRDGTLYCGVTANLPGRVWQHRHCKGSVFTTRYRLRRLVYFETADTMHAAIEREKQIKAGSRRRKIRLIENMNPDWRDLYQFVCGGEPEREMN